MHIILYNIYMYNFHIYTMYMYMYDSVLCDYYMYIWVKHQIHEKLYTNNVHAYHCTTLSE